jgi:hypothetical protein
MVVVVVRYCLNGVTKKAKDYVSYPVFSCLHGLRQAALIETRLVLIGAAFVVVWFGLGWCGVA